MTQTQQTFGRTGACSRRVWAGSVVAVLALAGASCSPPADPPVISSSGVAAQQKGLTFSPGPSLRPAGLSSQQGADAQQPAWAWLPDPKVPQGLQSRHPVQGYVAYLRPEGLRLTVGGEELLLGPAQVRCGQQPAPLYEPPVGAEFDRAKNRAGYAHATLYEWYQNGPLGLKQGFTLPAPPPACPPGEPLRIEMPVQGLRARGTGSQAVFVNDQDQAVLRYTDLRVKDATGQVLPAWLQARDKGTQIVLQVQWTQAAFPIEVDPLIWTSQQKLQPADKASGDKFGLSAVLSGDGNTALVGAAFKSDSPLSNNGDAYVLVKTGSTWTQQQKLQPTDQASDDRFGGSVALSGDGNTALVGAYKSDSPLSKNGDAYVLVKTGSTWTQQQKLQPTDKASGDEFGISVALSGDGNTALIGAPTKSDSPLSQNGDAYVLVRTGSTWTQQQKLQPTDKASGDEFGISVALSGDGNTALVGAWYKSDGPLSQNGDAYVFVRTGSTWTQQQKLQPADKALLDTFGNSVSLSGDGNTALVSAHNKSDSPLSHNGDAYVFVRMGSTWTQQQKLQSLDQPSNDDYFGRPVALSGDGNTALVGANNKSDGPLSKNGDAYLFVRTGSTWTQQQKLQPTDKASGDIFGGAVALSGDGNTVLVGAYNKSDSPLTQNGDAYVFLGNGKGASCTDGSQCANGNCIDGVCCDTPCGAGDPTDCQACSVQAGAAVNGSCSLLSSAAVCRPALGVCDRADYCTGLSASCPSDSVEPSSTVCRPSTGPADPAGFCDGTSKGCPSGVPSMSTGCGCVVPGRGPRPGTMVPLWGLFLVPLLCRRRHRSFPAVLLLGLGSLALLHCNNEPLIVLDLDPASVPTSATSLRLLTTLNGVDSLPQPLSAAERRIAVYLPGQPGTVQFRLDALDPNSCKVATAAVTYAVPGGLSQAAEGALRLSQVTPPACALTLNLVGNGLVTSSPAGISCTQAGSCTADFLANQAVQLNASSGAPAWTGCDTATGQHCSVVLSSSRKVGVQF